MPLRVSRALVTISMLLIAATPVTAQGEDRPDLRRFQSQYLKLAAPRFSTVTTLWAADSADMAAGVRPRINLIISNKSKRPFWLEVRLLPPPPHRGTTGTVYLEPKQSIEFESTQDSILADVDYPIDFSVFADSAFTDTLESRRSKMRFDLESVQALENRLGFRRREHASSTSQPVESNALPQAFEQIVVKKNMNFLTSLSGRMGHAGTLTVSASGLEFVTMKSRLMVEAAQVRGVSIRQMGAHQEWDWVVVEYEADGEKRTLWMEPSAFSGQSESYVVHRILAAVRMLMAQRAE